MINKQTFIDPLIDNNPITRQVLGICSALAVTVSYDNLYWSKPGVGRYNSYFI